MRQKSSLGQHQPLTGCPGMCDFKHKDHVIPAAGITERNCCPPGELGCSKCGIYGFLHFFSPWWTSRGDCPVCQGFSGPCLVCAPCPQMWHMWRRASPHLQEHSPTLWSWWWLHPCKLLQLSLNSLPEQVCTQAIHLICSPCISCDTL